LRLLKEGDSEELSLRIDQNWEHLRDLPISWNIAPTQDVLRDALMDRFSD